MTYWINNDTAMLQAMNFQSMNCNTSQDLTAGLNVQQPCSVS